MAAYTAGFMTHITCRLTAKNRDQLRNPTLGNRVWAAFTFLFTYESGRQLGQSVENPGSSDDGCYPLIADSLCITYNDCTFSLRTYIHPKHLSPVTLCVQSYRV